jgi:hypothetical protein
VVVPWQQLCFKPNGRTKVTGFDASSYGELRPKSKPPGSASRLYLVVQHVQHPESGSHIHDEADSPEEISEHRFDYWKLRTQGVTCYRRPDPMPATISQQKGGRIQFPQNLLPIIPPKVSGITLIKPVVRLHLSPCTEAPRLGQRLPRTPCLPFPLAYNRYFCTMEELRTWSSRNTARRTDCKLYFPRHPSEQRRNGQCTGRQIMKHNSRKASAWCFFARRRPSQYRF